MPVHRVIHEQNGDHKQQPKKDHLPLRRGEPAF